MWRAPFSCTNTSIAGVLAHERTDCSGMVEVNVREEDLAHVAEADPFAAEGRRRFAMVVDGPGSIRVTPEGP